MLTVRGWGAVSSAGVGAGALVAAGRRASAAEPVHPGYDVTQLYPQNLPTPAAHALVDFDIAAQLGRKGTSTLDRGTAMAVLAVGQAIADAQVSLTEESRRRVGLVLGTTVGSFKSTSDYSRETLEEERPYLVNPMLFPNTVMNRAAGQSAIWHGLKGVNATVAGGPLGFLHALRFARNAIRQGHADVILAGAVEEYTPHAAWLVARGGPEASAPAGEGAVVFAVGEPDPEVGRGDADILALATGFAPGRDESRTVAALAACVRRALRQAGLEPADVAAVATAGTGDDPVEAAALAEVLTGRSVPRLEAARHFGHSLSAGGALALALVLARHRDEPSLDGRVTLLTGRTGRGGFGVAVVRGWNRVGSHRG